MNVEVVYFVNLLSGQYIYYSANALITGTELTGFVISTQAFGLGRVGASE